MNRLVSILAFGSALALLAGCSGSSSGGGGAGTPAPTAGDSGTTAAASAPAATVTCADVCANVTKCGIAQATCNSVCPKLSLACQGCLAKATCQDACAQECGNIMSNPKKAPQPAPGQHCDALSFDFADHAATQDANNAGGSCVVPWDCRSQACVSGLIGTDQVAFCASEVDCRQSDPQLSDPCPTGWKCAQIPSANDGSLSRWTCVPPNATPCAEGQLSR